ncbi:TonB-dependent hemoglobin/transferrin/lactoferrin family receptor [Aeromonas veronii]|uniref:TonB-dependent hemoglobin/transferrin/lactoferrin family receptor n=1 Tax=Aeromonas veronii TaxID=654 RepID=UPI003D1FA667
MLSFASTGYDMFLIKNRFIITFCCTPFIVFASEPNEVMIIKGKRNHDINAITIDQKDISKNLAYDLKSLLRTQPDIGVTDGGRFGSNGLAIRGVDGDRVGIFVDGIQQAETFNNEIYKGYGYFNGTINETEVDWLKKITINRGSDSILNGSGSMGGSISYETLSPSDIIDEKKGFGFISKSAFYSRNDQKKETIGFASGNSYIDFMILNTYRKMHENKNHSPDNDVYGRSRGTPDPRKTNSNATLIKLNAYLTEKDTLGFSWNEKKEKTKTDEKSWELFGSDARLGDDLSLAGSLGAYYEREQNGFIKKLKISAGQQSIDQSAISIVQKIKTNKTEQIYNRRIKQDNKTLKMSMDFDKASTFNIDHEFALSSGLKIKKLKNENVDTTFFSNDKLDENYSIITPVKSEEYNISLFDQIKLNSATNLHLGIRKDWVAHKPGQSKPSTTGNKEHHYIAHNYSVLSMGFGLDYKPIESTTVSYKLGKGFRTPTAQELYFDFGTDGAANRLEPNNELKEESAITNEISLKVEKSIINAAINGYHTKYSDFIDLKQSERLTTNPWHPQWGPEFLPQNHLQYTNIDSAQINGVDASIKLDANIFLPGLSIENKISYQHGRASNGDSLMAVQPLKNITDLKYSSSNGEFEIDGMLTYSKGKKLSDAIRNGKEWKYVNDSYFVFDLIGKYQMTDFAFFRAGIFNVFNQEYTTWDAMRSIPEFGTTNMIDEQGKGLSRLTSPGRNFSAELAFIF